MKQKRIVDQHSGTIKIESEGPEHFTQGWGLKTWPRLIGNGAPEKSRSSSYICTD